MNENNQDQQIDDAALFASLTSDNPGAGQGSETAVTTAAPATPDPAATPSTTELAAEPAIPPSRLREEADARRNAERERDELRQKLELLQRQLAPQAQPQPRPEAEQPKEIWDDPNGFVQQALTPVQRELQRQREGFSRMMAEEKHGTETVSTAFSAMRDALQSDPTAKLDYVRIMSSMHPYGELVAWHKQRQTLQEVGSDPVAYKSRLLDEALKDPAFLARAIEASRQVAQPTVELPGSSSNVTSMPSLRNVGTTAAPGGNASEPSDAELFASVTSRRRA